MSHENNESQGSPRRKKISSEELAEAAQRMPIRHPDGFTQFNTEWLRNLYKRVGFYVQPTFEQWELGFMRDTNPQSETILWEAIARAYENYANKHPQCDHKQVVASMAAIASGGRPKEITKQWKEMERILKITRKKFRETPAAIVAEVAKQLGYSIDEDGPELSHN